MFIWLWLKYVATYLIYASKIWMSQCVFKTIKWTYCCFFQLFPAMTSCDYKNQPNKLTSHYTTAVESCGTLWKLVVGWVTAGKQISVILI